MKTAVAVFPGGMFIGKAKKNYKKPGKNELTQN